ncbi:MAG: hypothetical protein MUC81_02420 [Bacteroidia bacterium]|jgi:hypothetical protein|nr:hypothetical protein [Bacteroidia bacterium]
MKIKWTWPNSEKQLNEQLIQYSDNLHPFEIEYLVAGAIEMVVDDFDALAFKPSIREAGDGIAEMPKKDFIAYIEAAIQHYNALGPSVLDLFYAVVSANAARGSCNNLVMVYCQLMREFIFIDLTAKLFKELLVESCLYKQDSEHPGLYSYKSKDGLLYELEILEYQAGFSFAWHWCNGQLSMKLPETDKLAWAY